MDSKTEGIETINDMNIIFQQLIISMFSFFLGHSLYGLISGKSAWGKGHRPIQVERGGWLPRITLLLLSLVLLVLLRAMTMAYSYFGSSVISVSNIIILITVGAYRHYYLVNNQTDVNILYAKKRRKSYERWNKFEKKLNNFFSNLFSD